jgi:diguanylate cyclase (GGDEF)-like protein
LRTESIELERYQRQLEEYQFRLERSNALLQEVSETDKLTGIKNRRGFDSALEQECRRTKRHNTSLSLLFLDVDHFKAYNDSFGHQAGDEALTQLAKMLDWQARVGDFVARVGEKEFAVIMPDTTAEGAAIVAERLRSVIAHAVWRRSDITGTIGVATTAAGSFEPRELMAQADSALSRGKAQGRDRVVLFGEVEMAPAPAPEQQQYPAIHAQSSGVTVTF